jgi:hypothetical protein
LGLIPETIERSRALFSVAIPNNIKAVLDEKGITPYRLAKMWGKHPNHVYALVKPDTLPDGTALKTIKEIADLLDVSIDRLIVKDGK